MTAFNKQFYIEDGPVAFLMGFNEASGFFVTQMDVETVDGTPLPRPKSGIKVPMALMEKFCIAANQLFEQGGDHGS